MPYLFFKVSTKYDRSVPKGPSTLHSVCGGDIKYIHIDPNSSIPQFIREVLCPAFIVPTLNRANSSASDLGGRVLTTAFITNVGLLLF